MFFAKRSILSFFIFLALLLGLSHSHSILESSEHDVCTICSFQQSIDISHVSDYSIIKEFFIDSFLIEDESLSIEFFFDFNHNKSPPVFS